MRKIIYIFCFLVLFCAKTTAQNAVWRNLYIPNIPLSTNIQDLAFDKDTNFYAISDTSLFRYNGGVWSKFTPPLNANEFLRFLAIDNQNSVWASIEDKAVLRLKNNVWQRFDVSNSILSTGALVYMKYDSISKLMIFGTFNEVVTYNSITNTWTNIGLPPGFTLNFYDHDDLTIRANGDWYINSLGRRIDIYTPQTRVWSTPLSNFPSQSFTYKLSFDLKNNLYAADAYNTQIIKYDTITKSWKNLPFMKSQDRSRYNGLTVDKKNRMWYYSQENGVIRFDSLNINKFMTSNSPLYSNTINKVVVGPNNLKYIVGKGGGIQILDDANLPLAIKEVELQTVKMIERYNNPIQDRLILHFERHTPRPTISHLTIQICDLSGKLVFQNIVEVKQSTVELPVAFLPSGMYFVTCVDWQNKVKETIKVISDKW